MEQSEFKVGDYVMSLDLKDPYPFHEIVEKRIKNDLTEFYLSSIYPKNKFWAKGSWETLLFIDKNYVKVNKSTIDILFGGSKNGSKETKTT